VGGGFETGLRNRVPVDLVYNLRAAGNLRSGHEAEDTLLGLKALGAEYVVVHGPKSREYYRDFVRPERMAAGSQPVYRGEDDTIYALPPRGLAHLMHPEELPDSDVARNHDALTRYVAAIDDPARPALHTRWTDTSTLAMSGAAPPGHLVAVQVNADPGWRATQDGREIPITQDKLGFVVLHPTPAAETRIELHFQGTLEQRIMAALCALAWAVSLFVFLGKRYA
jgi:hypothetical protein